MEAPCSGPRTSASATSPPPRRPRAAATGSWPGSRWGRRRCCGVSTTTAVRAKLVALQPTSARITERRAGRRHLGQVLAARRALVTTAPGSPSEWPAAATSATVLAARLGVDERAGDPRGADPLAALVGDHDLVGRRAAAEVDGGRGAGDDAGGRGPVVGGVDVDADGELAQGRGVQAGADRARASRRARPRRRRAAARTAGCCPRPAWWRRPARRRSRGS